MLRLYLRWLRDALVFDDAIIASEQLFAEYGNLFALRPRVLSYNMIVWLHALVGDGWWVQRPVNVLLRLAVVAMLFIFYRQLLLGLRLSEATDKKSQQSLRWALFIGVAWYALNPTAVYAVAYLTQRSIVMATLFSVIALWAVLKALVSEQPRFWFAAILAYVAAMLSKEYALALPAVAVALIVLVRPSAKKMLVLGGIGLVLAAVAGRLLYAR